MIAAAPPLAAAAGQWDWVRSHPLPALFVVACYELLAGLAGVVGAAYGELNRRWSARLTEAIGAALRRLVSGYGRRYRRFLQQLHRDVDLKGLSTHSLGLEHMAAIVDIQVRALMKRLAERKITVDLTDAAKGYLVSEGYDPMYGARPLKRTLQRHLLDPLAMRVLQGEFGEGDRIVADAGRDGLTFAKARPVGV